MNDLIERLLDNAATCSQDRGLLTTDGVEGHLRECVRLNVVVPLQDEIERLTAEKETWDGHKVCELLRKDLAGAIAEIERLDKLNDDLVRAWNKHIDGMLEEQKRLRAALYDVLSGKADGCHECSRHEQIAREALKDD